MTATAAPPQAESTPAGASERAISFPAAGGWATLTVPIPMTEKAWNEMIKVLEAVKPAAVTEGEGD